MTPFFFFNWKGLDFSRATFDELQVVDRNQWKREVMSHEELFILLHDHLPPEMIYEQLPISILVGVLISLGVLSKQNEITAFKACGVSLYRLAAPILVGSTFFSGAPF